jgi:SAM-dependent methyltransferase
MNLPFERHSQYYDMMYADKDYAAEADYVATHLQRRSPNARRILELGCGTGAHAEYLARQGYLVHGIDLSAGMLAQAISRRSELPVEVAARLSFSIGDVRSMRLGHTFDAVISLFHVMSYQCTNEDLRAVYNTAKEHLCPGGVLLYDYWYGPAVLTQMPEVRVRHRFDARSNVTRITEPVMHWQRNVCDITCTLFVEALDTGFVQRSQETHPMRYLFQPELALLEASNWSAPEDFAWMTGHGPDASHWAAMRVISQS